MSTESTASLSMPNLSGRAFWRALYERDLDLVLLDLLHSSEAFRSRLLSYPELRVDTESEKFHFVGAWHSVVDDWNRESDLVAEWHCGDGRTLRLFIEDKIDARCQPGQASAYARRAAACQEENPELTTRTLLIAPLRYPEVYSEDTGPFEARLAIETIVQWLDEGLIAERGRYLADMLKHALRRWGALRIENGTSGKATYPIAYSIVREELPATAPSLSISNPKESPWIYFDFVGRKPGSSLRYRLADHWAELVFERQRINEDAVRTRLTKHPLPGGSIAERGHSEIAVWCETPEVDHSADILEQREPIRCALSVVDSMRRWYLDALEDLSV